MPVDANVNCIFVVIVRFVILRWMGVVFAVSSKNIFGKGPNMDTSDDPMTIAIVASTAFAGYSASQNKPGSPPVADPKAVITNGATDTQDARKKQKRKQSLMASVMTQDWDKPMLSESGLLGVG